MLRIKICFYNGIPRGAKAHGEMFFQETSISHTFLQEMLFAIYLILKRVSMWGLLVSSLLETSCLYLCQPLPPSNLSF